MDIQLEKIELLKKLLATEDVSVLESIKKIFEKEEKDWFEELPDYAKEGIEQGERDIAEGRVHSYEEVKQYFDWK